MLEFFDKNPFSDDITSLDSPEKKRIPFYLEPNSQGMTFTDLFEEKLDPSSRRVSSFSLHQDHLLNILITEMNELLASSFLSQENTKQRLIVLLLCYGFTNYKLMGEICPNIGKLRALYQLCGTEKEEFIGMLSIAINLLKALEGDIKTKEMLTEILGHSPESDEHVDTMKYRIYRQLELIFEHEERKDELTKVHTTMRDSSLSVLAMLNDPAFQVNESFGIGTEETIRREEHRHTMNLFPEMKLDFELLERERLKNEKHQRAIEKFKQAVEELENPQQMDLFGESDKEGNPEHQEKSEENISMHDLGPTEYDIRKQDREEKTSDSDRWGFGGDSWKTGGESKND